MADVETWLLKSTETVKVRKLDLDSHRDETTRKGAAVELPINTYVNSKLVATLCIERRTGY